MSLYSIEVRFGPEWRPVQVELARSLAKVKARHDRAAHFLKVTTAEFVLSRLTTLRSHDGLTEKMPESRVVACECDLGKL